MKELGNILILGDSYSTFKGFIPESYSAWYSDTGKAETDVTKVTETWWSKVLESTKSNLVLNCSFSGTTICNTGYNGEDCKHKSFIARLDKLIENGFFNDNKIDTVFIFGGTNDNWAGSPLGTLKYNNWEPQKLYSVLPAICYMLCRLKTNLPNVRIITLINTDLKEEITNALKEASKHYDAEYIELQNIDKMHGHPSVSGMAQIAEQVLENI